MSSSRECKRENEEYQECGTARPITCANYHNPPTGCTEQCVSDCFCKNGYYRASNRACVLLKDCF
uniref:TIL domain-containing protein n=1 Tax=Hottentotta judaicus TaxID=6863 RepID=F1CJ48_HOTJU|nr:hypothetical protein [Hottentotta judaicus]